MSISYRRLLKPKKCHKTFEVIILVLLLFYLRFRFSVHQQKRNVFVNKNFCFR